ncbi:SurA N-terminal domain-containing protein [Eubacterium aggregans]|uniref:SurA N-terminal domain-containing protein n=1 Tax=Eubacterium aggregans TaxID=81409 RepID=UPI003F3A776E
MKKTTIRKMALGLTVTLGLGMLFSGCSLVSVNPERDSAQTMMTIDGTDITKANYNNALACAEMYYAANGTSLPTGSDLKTMKKQIFDGVVQTQVLAAKAKKDGLKVDEAAAKKTGKSSCDSIKKEVDKKYNSTLSNNNTNDESFAAYMEDNAVTSAYADKCLTVYTDSVKKNPDDYLKTSLGTVDGTDVTRGEYNYHYIGQTLTAYYTTGAALQTDDATMKKTNETIFKNIGTANGMIKYCEENNIEISDDAIKTAQKTLQSTEGMFFSDESSLSDFLKNYELTVSKYKEYQKQEAKGNAAETAIKQKMVDDITVTDAQIKSYYEKNKNTYDTSTVSACHILTKNKYLSDEIYQKSKDCKTKEEFQKVMDEYKNNSEVTEDTDLGSFNRAKMVEAFSNKAFSMDVNTVGGPVKTDYGYHVIFVYDKKDGTITWEDNKDAITQAIKDEKGGVAFDKYKKKLIDGLKVDIGEIKTISEDYVDILKSELNVKVNEKVMD